MKATKAYLLAYNAACAMAWSVCVARTVAALTRGESAGEVYGRVGSVLMAAQTVMLLDILHALLGLVPSPVATVTIQVLCPIFVVWGHLFWVPDCQRHWSLFLILLPCGAMEVVRYAFYFCSLLGTVPYPMFYLRYSLFTISYPLGTAGQILQALVGMNAHWKLACPLWYRLSAIVLLLYVPGTPRQISSMWSNRKRSFEKRHAAKKEEKEDVPQGVLRPRTKNGDRSRAAASRGMLAAAAVAGASS